MSYEGYTERLCINGHYSACDVYMEGPAVCTACGGAIRYTHGVDQTNGYGEDDPHTCNAPRREIGFDDVWHEDHYGNRYASKLRRFAPEGDGIWIKVNSRGNATPPYLDDLCESDTCRMAETCSGSGRSPGSAVPERHSPNPLFSGDSPNG